MSKIRVLGTADWNAPIATNQHYVVQIMLDLGHQVVFQESIGLRSPELSSKDIKRMFRRIFPSAGQRVRKERQVPWNLQVYSPKVVPFHRGPIRRFNQWILHRKRLFEGDSPDILWTYTPLTYGLEENAGQVIYHCVDLLGKFPGIDEKFIEQEERRLARAGVKAIASSEVVRDHLLDLGFECVLYWPNVADLKVFSLQQDSEPKRKEGRVIFSGNITENKIDFDLLSLLVENGIELVLVGPHSEGGGDVHEKLSKLELQGVTVLGAQPLDKVAYECRVSHLGIIPYAINEYTSGVSPLKTYEYAASGLPVVSTDLPGVEQDSAGVWKELTSEAFLRRVLSLLEEQPGSRCEALHKLAFRHSWERRAVEIENLIGKAGETQYYG